METATTPSKVYIIQQTSFAYNDGYVTAYCPEKFYLTKEAAEDALAEMIIEEQRDYFADIYNDRVLAPVGSELYVEFGCDYSEEDYAKHFDPDEELANVDTMAKLKEHIKGRKRAFDDEDDWYRVVTVSLG